MKDMSGKSPLAIGPLFFTRLDFYSGLHHTYVGSVECK